MPARLKTAAEAAGILVETIRGNLRHEFYPYVCEYADRLKRLITGHGIELELRQIVERETPKQFQLRKKLFFSVVPSACDKARVPFYKVSRSQGYKLSIAYDGESADARKSTLQEALDGFYGDESIADYMNDRFLDLNRTDPNAFVMVNFMPFDNVKQKAQPFPVEVSCHQAINIGYDRNQVQWMIAQFDHQYLDPVAKKMVKGQRFVMWFGDVYEFKQMATTPVAVKLAPGEPLPDPMPPIVEIADKCYSVELFQPFSESQREDMEFPGIMVGHKKDPLTGGRTFLSSIHSGINRMLDTLKSGSERSLVMALVAHPQIFQYLPKCPGEKVEGQQGTAPCNNGVNSLTNQKCRACNGTGRTIQRSVLDVITMDLPHDATSADLVKLADLKHISSPDTAIITVLIDYLRQCEMDIQVDIFASTSIDRQQIVQTATEALIDEDSVNNAVYPYARKRAFAYVKLVRLCAFFTDTIRGLKVAHSVPDDLRLAPVAQLIDDMGKAKANSAAPEIGSLIEDDIMAKKLADQPEELLRYQVRKRYRPYKSLDAGMRQSLILGGTASAKARVLVVYEDEIYRSLERRLKDFYRMEKSAQEDELMKEVEAFLAKEAEEQAAQLEVLPPETGGQGGGGIGKAA